MRVIHLLQSHRFSGAENVVCQIIDMMREHDDIEFIYCSRDGQIREALKEREIPFFPIDDLNIKEVRRVIKELNPDIIHAHDMRASFVAATVSKNIPIISHIHNNNFNSRGISAKSIAYLFAGLKSDHIFWVSDSSFNGYVFHDLLKNKSEVLYNIIDINALYDKMLLDKENYDYDVVYLGRLTAQKNPVRLMKVFRKLTEKKADIKIAVIGTGELERETVSEAEKLDLMDNVHFLGFQNNPYKILHDSKVMVLTSLWEGTPMCVLEAMSLGVPVVSTPTDGICKVVKQGVTGFLSDEDDELVNKCLEIINNPEKRLVMSRSSSARATELMNTESYFNSINKIYTDALD